MTEERERGAGGGRARAAEPDAGTPLSPEDLSFWVADQPRQRTTMAMLMLLDRAPEWERLRAAMGRAVEQVPRLRQRVVDAPLDLALPRWRDDPTFDLDFHLRRYALASPGSGEDELDALFRTIGPIYERPFDRTRPLWELIEIDRGESGAALFFKLHHAVADGVGGNAILAALTDADARGEPLPPPPAKGPGGWEDERALGALARALRDRVGQDADRARAVASALWRTARAPSQLGVAWALVASVLDDARHAGQSPLRRFGRARHLTGIDVAFEPLREAKRALDGRMIDVLLTAVAGALRRWHVAHGYEEVHELLTLVPINLRARKDQGLRAGVGNRATGINVRLPIDIADPRERFAEIHRRVAERQEHPAARVLPQVAAVLASLPRPLYRALAWSAAQSLDLIVTNVPGLPMARYVAGAEIRAAYPFAPVAPRTPVSIALYGYRDRLFVGLDANGVAMPDLPQLRDRLREGFAEVVEAAARPVAQRGARRPRSRKGR